MADILSVGDCINKTCPWSGEPVSADALMFYRGHVVGFCNQGCRDKFLSATIVFDAVIDKADVRATKQTA